MANLTRTVSLLTNGCVRSHCTEKTQLTQVFIHTVPKHNRLSEGTALLQGLQITWINFYDKNPLSVSLLSFSRSSVNICSSAIFCLFVVVSFSLGRLQNIAVTNARSDKTFSNRKAVLIPLLLEKIVWPDLLHLYVSTYLVSYLKDHADVTLTCQEFYKEKLAIIQKGRLICCTCV